MAEFHALLDHVLEEVDQVSLLEEGGLAVGLAPEFAPAPVIVLAQQFAPARAEFRHADEFACRFLIGDGALYAFHAAVRRDRLLGVVRWMLAARPVMLAPIGIDAKRDVGAGGDEL